MYGYPPITPTLFVASSTQSVNISEALRSIFPLDDIRVKVWKDLGVFPLSEHSIESLENVINICDYGVFVLGPDDIILDKNGFHRVTRDNVIFELGLFIGKIGRKRSFMLKESGVKIKLPSDLEGITWAEFKVDKTRKYDLSKARDQIKQAIDRAPRTPTEETLSDTIFPPIVLRHCFPIFQKYVSGNLKLFKPKFFCDAQITTCLTDGRIISHPRVSSIGHKIQTHDGKVIWASFQYHDDSKPFKLLLEEDNNQWVAWFDNGFSQLYTPMTGRHNHRICIAHSWRTKRKIYFLEIHQELSSKIDDQLTRVIVNVINHRMKEVFE